MTHLGYLIAGWGISLSALGLYAWSLARRGRALALRVPADRQRWMTTGGPARLDQSSSAAASTSSANPDR